MPPRTALVTGVSGFLGRYVARALVADGWSVVGLASGPPENAPLHLLDGYHRLTLPSPALAGLLREGHPDACVHCAGRASVDMSMREPSGDFEASVAITAELLEALRRHAPACRTVYVSSAAVYGEPARLPIREHDLPHPISPYGFHRYVAEQLCLEYARVFELPVACARAFSAYGPGLRRQIVWDLCRRALSEPVVELRGTGDESRDFIHGHDVGRALAQLVDRAPAQGEVYNVATGIETTIRELAGLVLAQFDAPPRLEFTGAAHPGNPANWRADVTRIGQLGFVPEIDLARGVAGYLEWCRAELSA
jgi:UDP-glucose 4-epimerase